MVIPDILVLMAYLLLILFFFSGITINVDEDPIRPEVDLKNTKSNLEQGKKQEVSISDSHNSVYPKTDFQRDAAHASSPAMLSVSFSCLILAFLLHHWSVLVFVILQ